MNPNFVVHIRKGTKRITLQRLLISKIVYGQEFSELELAALFHNQLWLDAKATTDRDFQRKFGEDLESITKILREVNFSRGLTPGSLANCRNKLLALSWDFPFPRRNISTVEAQLRNAIYTKWRKPQGIEVKRLPPEKYIGKGYRDKGTAQRPEYDGNPAWQEVASASANLQRNLEEKLDAVQRMDGKEDFIEQINKLEELRQAVAALDKFNSRTRNR